MESNTITEQAAGHLVEAYVSANRNLKSALDSFDHNQMKRTILQTAINSVMEWYMKKISSYMKFDWSYPFNRLYCFLFQKRSLIKMRDLLKEMNDKIEEVKRL